MSYLIYHNPHCSKSRCALQVLQENNDDVTIVEYLKEPLSREELEDLLKKLAMKAEQLIRKSEPIFKEEFQGKVLSEKEWIEAMVQYPRLIQRPIIVKGDRAVVGRSIENLDKL